MSHTTDLLDAYKRALGLRTDMAAAEALGITRGAVSAWRSAKNRRHAEPESVESMAKACGLDPEEWVLRVQADREGEVNPRRAQVWVRCADRLAKAALAAAIVLAFGRLDVHHAHMAGTLFVAHNPGTLSIM
jgi:hypothetical protein